MSPMSVTRDHPRIRGEHGHRVGNALDGVGDHPRIRGEHEALQLLHVGRAGIIPAYAGSTLEQILWHIHNWGSSPHTRGALDCDEPAVGRSVDHPRIRGEHEQVSGLLVGGDGIIPAYAGSTGWTIKWVDGMEGSSPHTRGAPHARGALRSRTWDHPRIRGEHYSGIEVTGFIPGIIPAYAGSTLNDLRNYTAFLNSRFGYQGTFTHQHATSAAPLSPKPSCRSILARVTPSRLRHSEHRRVVRSRWSLHQLDPLTVNRLPVRLKRLER